MRENIWCWLSGIIGSALGMYVLYHSKLYSESILYLFYIAMGVYGWYVWYKKGQEKDFKIIKWAARPHLLIILTGLVLSAGLASFFSRNTDAAYPWVDAHTTVFSIIASYMEAHKILSSWFFWIIINGVTIWMYGMKELNFFSGQMAVYFILSIWGYISWKKRMING